MLIILMNYDNCVCRIRNSDPGFRVNELPSLNAYGLPRSFDAE